MEIKILITSPPDRENLVAEIWVDECQLAEISHEGEVHLVELYPHPGEGTWRISLERLQQAMKEADARLSEIEGRVRSS